MWKKIVGIEKVLTVAEGVLIGTPYYNKKTVFISGTVLQKCNITNEVSYIVPEGITEIAENAFYSGESEDELETVVLPDSVHVIGKGAFNTP